MISLAEAGMNLGHLSAGFGAGLALIGGAYGLSKIAASANEGIARQPEAAAQIRGNTIIIAAMLEVATLFGVVVTFMLASAK